jgi:Glycosyltransferase family 87
MSVAGSRNRRFFKAAWALGLALVGAASMCYYEFGLFMPRVEEVRAAKHLRGEYSFGDDFYPIWLTSREWIHEHRDPYNPAVTRDIQIGLFGRALDGQFATDPPSDYRTFAYPAFTNLLFWPLSAISFPVLRIAWTAILVTLLAACVALWTQALSWHVTRMWLTIICLLTVCSYPELEGLYAGQLGLLVGFLLAASLLALVRKRLMLSGILMALTTIKPQMTGLAILYLLIWSGQDWRSRSRFTLAFLLTMLLLVTTSLAVWPHWIGSWMHVVLAYPRYATPPLGGELLGVHSGSYGADAATIIFLIVALALAWRSRAAALGSREFWLTLSLLLAIATISILPGQSVHDHVILLPGIFLLGSGKEPQRRSPIFRVLVALGAAVLLWPWVAAAALITLRPFIRSEYFYSKAVFVLPFRTAAAFPFVVLGLLTMAWRAFYLQQRNLESSSLRVR